MCDLGNNEIKYTAGIPKEYTALNNQLQALLKSKMSSGATQYSGQVAAPLDQLQSQASNIMSQLMYGTGHGGQFPTSGGGGYSQNPRNPMNLSVYNGSTGGRRSYGGGNNSVNGDFGGGYGPTDPTLPSNPFYPGGGGPNIPSTKPIFIGGRDPGLKTPPVQYDPITGQPINNGYIDPITGLPIYG